MMGNIILLAFKYDHNLGDQVICECMTKYLKDALPENIELRVIDLKGTEIDIDLKCIPKLKRKVIIFLEKIITFLRIKNIIKTNNKLIKYIKIMKVKNIAKNIYNDNTKAIIFAGGGLIKYKNQLCHFFLEAFITEAELKRIPIMLSGVGVEDYNENNIECQMLKKAINCECVKVITTRDDIDCLIDKYKIREDLIIKRVADPACSCECFYKKDKCIHLKEKKIGLGITRKDLFSDNGINFTKEEQIKFWFSIIRELEKRNYVWEFFTNGLDGDYAFAKEIIKSLNLSEEKLRNRPSKCIELINAICSYDAAIVCRLHASIIAYSYNIPTIGLIWNNKQKMFGERIGYPERFIGVDCIDVKYIVDTLENSLIEGYKKINNLEYKSTTYKEVDKFLYKFVFDIKE